MSAACGDAVDFDGAAVGLDHAAEDLHQGRFAGAVLADEADDLAGPHVHAEIGQRHDAGIGLAQPRQLEERLGGAGDTAAAAADAVIAPRSYQESSVKEMPAAGLPAAGIRCDVLAAGELLLEVGLELLDVVLGERQARDDDDAVGRNASTCRP